MKSRKKDKNLRPMLEVCESMGIMNASSTLLASINYMGVDRPIRSIAITSATPNEGKSTVAISLAKAVGQSGKTCLLVEGDMRRRSLRTTLGAHTTCGLHALLTGNATADEAIVRTSLSNVFFLDAEPGIPNPGALISSERFAKSVGRLSKNFGYMVFDTPPVAAFADAVVLSRLVDGTILVVREGSTNRRDAELAVEQLQAAGANLLGTVMNGCVSQGSDAYGYYYGYYYEEQKVPANSLEGKAALHAAWKGAGKAK